MSRLTARNAQGLPYLVNVKDDEQEVDSPHKNTLRCILDCFDRLAALEDILYSPDGTERISLDLLRDLTKMVDTVGVDRLREIVEAEADGRCVVLPKKGDKLFYAPHPFDAKDCDGEPMFLRNTGDGSGIVKQVRISVYFDNWSGPVPLSKTWADRAEAEAVLGGSNQNVVRTT